MKAGVYCSLLVAALLLAACASFTYAPGQYRSDGFRVTQGALRDLTFPQSVCFQLEPGVQRPVLKPLLGQPEGFPPCNTAVPTLRVAIFVLQTGCFPEPCSAPLGGYAVLSTGECCNHAQAVWNSFGGKDPEAVFLAFQRELSVFLHQPPGQDQ